MQVLERNDGKKWMLWSQFGRVNADNAQSKINEYYNRFDAIVDFEKHFFSKTGNKWVDKEVFQQKPGRYNLVKKE